MVKAKEKIKCKVKFATHDYAILRCGKRFLGSFCIANCKIFSVSMKNEPIFGGATWKQWEKEVKSLETTLASLKKRKYDLREEKKDTM